jgi:hypothetical protein
MPGSPPGGCLGWRADAMSLLIYGDTATSAALRHELPLATVKLGVYATRVEDRCRSPPAGTGRSPATSRMA